jgi:hypothetical protein
MAGRLAGGSLVSEEHMMRTMSGQVILTDYDVRDIVDFLERVTPRGADEAMRLQELIFGMDPRAGDHDR